MSRPISRLILFVLGIIASLGILEWVVRGHVELFAATNQRALAKLALFERSPRTEVLFFGTSRTEGGISPELFKQAIKEIAPELGDFPGYNAAFPGSTIALWTSTGPRFAVHPGPRLAVVEISSPQITNSAAPWEDLRPSVTVEDKLANSFQRLAFVRYRSALSRLPDLLAYTWLLTQWKTNSAVPATIWPAEKEEPAAGFDRALWTPELFLSTAAPQSLDPSSEQIANQLTLLVQQFRNVGVKVVFAVPPLAREYLQSAPEKNEMRPLFSEVARRTACEVWNFNAQVAPDSFFYNPSHLNALGRAHYSRAMAIQVARLVKAQ